MAKAIALLGLVLFCGCSLGVEGPAGPPGPVGPPGPQGPPAIGGSTTYPSGAQVAFEPGSALRLGGDVLIAGDCAVSSTGNITFQNGSALVLRGAVTPLYDIPRAFTRMAILPPIFDPASWTVGLLSSPLSSHYTAKTVSGSAADHLVFIIDPPDGSVLTEVSVWTDPPAGHGGVDPNAKTTLEVYEQDMGSAATPLCVLEDPATVAGTYEMPHAVIQTGLSIPVIRSTDTYIVVITPEHGGSALIGTQIFPPQFQFTRDKLGEE